MRLGFLRPLYTHLGGYVSVYLDTSRGHENAPGEVRLRWRAARQELAGAGADAETLRAVEDAVLATQHAGLAVFARDGEVVLSVGLPSPPRRETSRLAPLPHLMPLLAQLPPSAPHLRVAAQRAGGEVLAVTESGGAWSQHAQAHRWPVHKVSTGGWSEARIQRSAEVTWDENAKALAAAVTDIAEREHAELIVVAGDVRARSLLLGHLPAAVREHTMELDKEVAVDSGAMAEAADQALRVRAERECRARFDDWRALTARDRSAAGLAAVFAGFRDGAVADLFLVDHPSSAATAWVGPAGLDAAVTPGELRERGVADPWEDRADAALVRAVVTTDAELHFLPGDLATAPGDGDADQGTRTPGDGVCATLRWPQGTTG